ncbi:unnamed protein product [Rhodiola kirilowii]
MRLIFSNFNSTRKFYAASRTITRSALAAIDPPSVLLPHNPSFRDSRRWHLGHSNNHHDHKKSAGEEGEKIFRIGLAADVCLSAAKAFTGYVSGSTAIIADAAHSISDVVLSGVALWSYKASRVPKDIDHPYGHGKFETLGALGISVMLLATSGGIAWHALELLLGMISSTTEIHQSTMIEHSHHHGGGGHHHGIDMEHPILALSVAIVSISVKEGLYWMTKRAGERSGSGLMKANAWHHRADAISSVVALIGVGGSILGVKFFDPLAGVVVSCMILKAGLETGYQSILELVDASIPAQDLYPVKQTILQVEGVKGCHHLRGRRAGSFLYLDVHIEVDPFLSVSAAHCIGENVRGEIHKSHPEVTEVFIHIDPSLVEKMPEVTNQGESDETCIQATKIALEQKKVECIVKRTVSSKFSKEMAVERITHHLFQGRTLLEIEVVMPPHMTIGDAMRLAEQVENEILKAATNIVQASIHVRLGHPINVIHTSQGGSKVQHP